LSALFSKGLYDVLIGYERYVAHLRGLVYAPFGEARLGEEIKAGVSVWEELTSVYKSIQDAYVYLFIGPLALAKQSGIFIDLAHNIYLDLFSGF
jgi:hypothetical protein